MIIIPTALFRIATFPGVVIGVFTRRLVCWLLHIPVYKTAYFSAKAMYRYLWYTPPGTGKTAALFMLSFWIDVLLGAFILLPASLTVTVMGFPKMETWRMLTLLLQLWFGFSILMQAIPSRAELDELEAQVVGNREAPWGMKLLCGPLYFLLRILDWGRVVFLDVAFAFGVMMLTRYIAITYFLRGL